MRRMPAFLSSRAAGLVARAVDPGGSAAAAEALAAADHTFDASPAGVLAALAFTVKHNAALWFALFALICIGQSFLSLACSTFARASPAHARGQTFSRAPSKVTRRREALKAFSLLFPSLERPYEAQKDPRILVLSSFADPRPCSRQPT